MALPLIAIGLLGAYAIKKIIDSNNEKDRAESDLRQMKEQQRQKDDNLFDVETIPFAVATLYAVANIDGIIDDDEEAFIRSEIANILNSIQDDKVQDRLKKSIKSIERKKLSIKLSDAIDYITVDNQDFIRKDLRKYKELANQVAKEDGRLDPAEEELLKRLDIIYNKGRDAREDIIKLENQDLLPNYYLSSSSENKKITPSTVVITSDNKDFTNIYELQFDKHYVQHPMDPNRLFDLQNLDKIDEFQFIELQSLVTKLGAKSFSSSVIQEATESRKNDHSTEFGVGTKYASFDAEISAASSKEEYEKKFTQYRWTAEGNKSSYTKEMLMNSLLWLKHDRKSHYLIDAMTEGNKLKDFSFEISFKEFKTNNSSFNLSTHLSLLEKINSELKTEIESNINKSLDYKLKIDIVF
jgi:tellurite resistance protein